jgi:heme/copper-type cytochrome/quinol oxidase subunit 3
MDQDHVTTGIIAAATGTIPSGKLGIWWFLASEIITFGGLIGSYIVFRLANPPWTEEAHHLSVLIATINTIVLLTSSLTMVLAFAAVDQQDEHKTRTWLLLTVVGGLVFLVIKAFEWSLEIGAGRVPGASGFWSFYFTLTGLHGLHVLGGIVVNAILWLTAVRDRLRPVAHRVEYAGLYWHFVDIVWILLFPLLYLS